MNRSKVIQSERMKRRDERVGVMRPMPITSLNKVLNLFAGGLFVITILTLYVWEQIVSHVTSARFKVVSDAISEPILVRVSALMLFSLALLAGLVVESVLSIVKTFLKSNEKHTLISLLRCQKQVAQTEDIRAEFRKIFAVCTFGELCFGGLCSLVRGLRSARMRFLQKPLSCCLDSLAPISYCILPSINISSHTQL